MSDKVTIVSVAPFAIRDEKKPGVYPGNFTLEKAPLNGVSVLVVGSSKARRYIGDGEYLFLDEPAAKMAESVVFDYKRSKLAYRTDDDGNEIMPGLFVVPGEHTAEQVLKLFAPLVDKAREMQKMWLKALVELADDSWAREHQHKLITDEMRFAARTLGLTREWDINAADIGNMMMCGWCSKQIASTAIKCPNCLEVVNQEAYDKRKAAQEKKPIPLQTAPAV